MTTENPAAYNVHWPNVENDAAAYEAALSLPGEWGKLGPEAVRVGYWPTDESAAVTRHWRMGRVHILKTVQPYFGHVRAGHKAFEVRFNDRDYQPDDMLILAEWDGEVFTGQDAARKITYVLRDGEEFGVKPGYVVLGLVNPRG